MMHNIVKSRDRWYESSYADILQVISHKSRGGGGGDDMVGDSTIAASERR